MTRSFYPKINDTTKDIVLSYQVFDTYIAVPLTNSIKSVALITKRYRYGMSITRDTRINRNKFRSRNELSSWGEHFITNSDANLPKNPCHKVKYLKKRKRE